MDFSGGPAVKNLLASAGDIGSVPGLGRSHMPWSNAKPVHPYLWAHALVPESYNYWSPPPLETAVQQEEPPQWEDHCAGTREQPLLTTTKVHRKNEDPVQAKIN